MLRLENSRGRQHARGGFDRTPHGAAQLQRAKRSEVLRMLQKADIVHADYDGRGTEDRRRVLHVQQVRTILAQPARNIEAQAHKWIHRDAVLEKAIRQVFARRLTREIGHKIGIMIQRRETMQEITDVSFVPRKCWPIA